MVRILGISQKRFGTWAKTYLDYLVYGKCSKHSNLLLFFFSSKMVVIRAGINKVLVKITKREDPGQTASLEAVLSVSALFI